jgi:hypothetical protein
MAITKEEWDLEVQRLFAPLKGHTKAKEYAKDIDEFLRTSTIDKEDARTIAVAGGVRIILRDIAVIMEKRNIKLQRGMDAILKEAGDKWKSVVRNSTEMKLQESDAIPLLVNMSAALAPEFGKALARQFGGSDAHVE